MVAPLSPTIDEVVGDINAPSYAPLGLHRSWRCGTSRPDPWQNLDPVLGGI